jgi:hypothetical protein
VRLELHVADARERLSVPIKSYLAHDLLSVHAFRRRSALLYLARAVRFVGVLIDKGIFTVLAKAAIPIELGRSRSRRPD